MVRLVVEPSRGRGCVPPDRQMCDHLKASLEHLISLESYCYFLPWIGIFPQIVPES